jgi:alpha-galactosidase
MTSRREFLQRTTISAAGLWLPLTEGGGSPEPWTDTAPMGAPRSFVDVRRPPDSITVQTATGDQRLRSVGGGRWEGTDAAVSIVPVPGASRVDLSSPKTAVTRVRLRWRAPMDSTRLLLGDAWERGYGDFEWRAFVPDRVMPWYFAAWDGEVTPAYGVRTGAKAFCFWHADPQGISLWADVRSGGVAVQLGERVLNVCEVVCRAGQQRETAFAAIHAFCKQMCAAPRLPAQPVYGSNDWYWAYGKNSAATVLADAQHVAELSPSGTNRPFAVIDDGWQPVRGEKKTGVGTWDHGNFPDS